jgi:hypothetical protein
MEKSYHILHPGAAAYYYYPEVFQKFRDSYLESYMRKVVVENQPEHLKTVDVYMGNFHVSPVSRLWNTNTTKSSPRPTLSPQSTTPDED